MFGARGKDYYEDSFVTRCGQIGAVFNAGSRIVIALIYEKLGFRVAILVVLVIQVVSALLFNVML
jgi:hypothetical protein